MVDEHFSNIFQRFFLIFTLGGAHSQFSLSDLIQDCLYVFFSLHYVELCTSFPSFICLNEINGHSGGQIHSKLTVPNKTSIYISILRFTFATQIFSLIPSEARREFERAKRGYSELRVVLANSKIGWPIFLSFFEYIAWCPPMTSCSVTSWRILCFKATWTLPQISYFMKS